MFNSRIIVQPEQSDAVKRLEWVSHEEVLYIQYNSSDNAYTETEVSYEMFSALCHEAHRRGSWGSGLHNWKVAREEAFYIRDRNAFEDFVEEVHPETLRRFYTWMSEEIRQRDLATKSTRVGRR